jgi:hypothetical protein
MLSIGFFVRNMINFWVNFSNSEVTNVYQIIIIIALTQLIYNGAKWKYGNLQAEIELSNGNYVGLVYIIMCYLYGN